MKNQIASMVRLCDTEYDKNLKLSGHKMALLISVASDKSNGLQFRLWKMDEIE